MIYFIRSHQITAKFVILMNLIVYYCCRYMILVVARVRPT